MSSHAIEIAQGDRFEFGKNWSRFLTVLDDARVARIADRVDGREAAHVPQCAYADQMLAAHGGFNGGGCIEQSATRHRFSFHIYILRTGEPSAKIGRQCFVSAAVFCHFV